jgi:hypothetical protein
LLLSKHQRQLLKLLHRLLLLRLLLRLLTLQRPRLTPLLVNHA